VLWQWLTFSTRPGYGHRYLIEMGSTLPRLIFTIAVAVLACAPAFADDTFTSPQTIVNVTITQSSNGSDMIFTGAELYFETVQSSYHLESQRDRLDLANRTQRVTMLQSKLVRFGVHQLKFRSVAGDDLDVEDVRARIQKNPLALMLPFGASIHPQLIAALNPDTIVVTRADRRPTPQRLVPRPDSK